MVLTCDNSAFAQVSAWLTTPVPSPLRSRGPLLDRSTGGLPIPVSGWAETAEGTLPAICFAVRTAAELPVVRVPGPDRAGGRDGAVPASVGCDTPGPGPAAQ